MEFWNSQRLGESTYFVTQENMHQGNACIRVYPSLEAIYIYSLLAIQPCHFVGLQISLVPFSLLEFPGQVFYCVKGAFARCCDEIQQDEIQTPVIDAAEIIYGSSVPWHKWNLRASGIWTELEQPFQGDIVFDTCSNTIRKFLEHLITESPRSGSVSSQPEWLSIGEGDLRAISSSSVSGAASSNLSSRPMTPEPRESSRGKRKRRNGSSTPTEPVTGTADIFLERLNSARITDADVLSYLELTRIENPSVTTCGENVSRAWDLCISFVRQSSQKLKYGRFLRFLSLCFFLIWERYSHKQGKSAAREVNAKMREAGFSGHSRGLKTMRDETTLINTIIASIQANCGFEQADMLYHIIFEAPNYQLVRTINRLAKSKQASIVEYMCDNINVRALTGYPTTAIHVQSIIKQYLPELSLDAINAAIGYQPLEQSNAAAPRRIASSKHPRSAGNRNRESADDTPLSLHNNPVADMTAPLGGSHGQSFTAEQTASGPGALGVLPGGQDPFLDFLGNVETLNFDFIFNEVDMIGKQWCDTAVVPS